MPWSSVLPLLLLWAIVFWEQAQQRRAARLRRMRRRRRQRGEKIAMNELIQTMMGKECLISIPGSGTVQGTPVALEGSWLHVQQKEGQTMLNLDYISQIREYPRRKNGKKKAVVLE